MAVAEMAASGLAVRVVVGALLIAVALAAVWAGGIAFTALIAVGALLMNAEWSVMHGIGRGFRLASLVLLAFTAGIAANLSAGQAVVVLAAGAGLLALFFRSYDRRRAFWLAAGLLYCGLPLIALIWLRGLPNLEIVTVAVLATVWATDIGAYFTGRALGGAKLAPSISPNKTWAGAVGGVVAAMVTGALFGVLARGHPIEGDDSFNWVVASLAAVGGVFAIVAIGGDLFESWLKRRAGVKDSGTILPGHGGVMDRLDGLVPVAVVAALLVAVSGIAR